MTRTVCLSCLIVLFFGLTMIQGKKWYVLTEKEGRNFFIDSLIQAWLASLFFFHQTGLSDRCSWSLLQKFQHPKSLPHSIRCTTCDNGKQKLLIQHREFDKTFFDFVNPTCRAPTKESKIQRSVLPLLTEPPNLVKNVCLLILKLEWKTSTVLSKVISIFFTLFCSSWTNLVLNTFVEQGDLHLNSASW